MNNTPIPVPALRGQWPHQWMAALGLLRLLAEDADLPTTRLHWDREHGHAVLTGPLPTLAAVADTVLSVINSIPADGVLPGVSPNWPPRRSGTSGGDPALSWPPQIPDGPRGSTWWSACLAQHPVERQVMRSPYIHRKGQQSVRTFFGTPLRHLTRDSMEVRESLQRGRRLPSYTGELLDAGAYADGPEGVAGAEPLHTWLAAMSLPVLGPVSVDAQGKAVAACCRGNEMVYPLWGRPLDVASTRMLVSMEPGDEGWLTYRDGQPVRSQEADLLEVWQVKRGGRRQVGKYDWPLAVWC